jgi:hypothetical protein
LGCGGGASNEVARTAAFVALANKVCRVLDTKSANLVPIPDAPKMRALVQEDHNLRSLHKLFADVEARRKLRETVQRITKGKSSGTLPPGIEPLEESYRLSVKIYEDQKALGMTACAERPRAPIGG